jgi:transposase
MSAGNNDRSELLEIIRRQEVIIAQLRAENVELREQVAELLELVRELQKKLKDQGGSSDKVGPDFVKPNRLKDGKQGGRKKRTKNFARKREEPTQRIVHASGVCGWCGCPLVGGSVKRIRQVLHVPVVPVEVIEHVYIERRCPICGQRNVPKVDLEGVVGQHRVSGQTMALVATLREVGRLPVGEIQWHLETFHGLKLSLGEIVEILHTVREKARGVLDGLVEELRASPVVHGDETGWREGGQNGYLWSFSGPTVRYFEYRKSRSGEIVTELLGQDFEGTLVSDFYGGYNRMMGRHQRCWVHLLRDIHESKEKWPEDTDLGEWAKGVNKLYHRARDWVLAHPQAKEAQRVRAQRGFEEELMALCRPYIGSERPQRVLCERIEKFLPELFVFVADPRVPSDNNAAERAVRPAVISRKISGGTRSPRGSQTKSSLASLFGTWTIRGQNPFASCFSLLTSTQV